jgi:flagellar hook-length control protein FliK
MPAAVEVLGPEAALALQAALAGQSGENVDPTASASTPQAQAANASPAKTNADAETFNMAAKLAQAASAAPQAVPGAATGEQQAPIQPAGAVSAAAIPQAAANTGKPAGEGSPGLTQDPKGTPTPEPAAASSLAAATLEKTRFVVGTQETEPARLAEARTTELVRQVTHGLETAVKSHQISMRLQLFPEDMGRIDLRLTAGTHGLGITLSAEQPGTSQLLEANLGKLQQALAGAGISLSSLNIGQGQSQSSMQQGNTWQQSQRGLPGFPFQENTSEAKWTEPIRNVNQAAAGVDYRV